MTVRLQQLWPLPGEKSFHFVDWKKIVEGKEGKSLEIALNLHKSEKKKKISLNSKKLFFELF